MRAVGIEPRTKPVGSEGAGGVAWQPERSGDRRTEQRIAERAQDERERALGNVMLLTSNAELGDQAANRIQDGVERVTVAGEDHPRGQRAGSFTVENVERPVDDVAGVDLPGARPLHCLGDA